MTFKLDGRTHKGNSSKSYGGVGRNIAAALVSLGAESTKFVTVVGDDVDGETIIKSLGKAGSTIRKLPGGVTAR